MVSYPIPVAYLPITLPDRDPGAVPGPELDRSSTTSSKRKP